MKSAIFITARLKSTRLPLKVIKEIKGRPMISHMIERLRLSHSNDQIVLCTSTLEQDDILVEICKKEDIDIFRGHPDDVLFRLAETATNFNVDCIISCTADNPFVDPFYIDRLFEFHINNKFDYSNIEGLPFGTFSYVLNRSALLKACEIKDAIDTEVWGEYFTKTGLFTTGTMKVTDPAVRRPNLRLTVDTPEDFRLISAIFDRLYEEGKIFSLEEIVYLCDKHPELVKINSHIIQAVPKPIKVKN